MSFEIVQLLVFVLTVFALTIPTSRYISWSLDDRASDQSRRKRWIGRFGQFFSIDTTRPMAWPEYARAVVLTSGVSYVVVYLLQRLQGYLPLNPEGLPGVKADSAFNTALSFVTNTNWQGYAGEATMSYFTQSGALTVQNFVSAGTGIAVLMALVRGCRNEQSSTIGNYYRDLIQSTCLLLVPLSIVLALGLVSQGVIQTYAPYQRTTSVEKTNDNDVEQSGPTIALGPAASQVAIKQLGTNGGGFFNANSSHPLENPTPFTNLIEAVALLLIPAALCLAYGSWVGDQRQGWSLLALMSIVLLIAMGVTYWVEQSGNPTLASLSVDQSVGSEQCGGNMEGKEARLGIANSALWAVATTAASNGSVNSMHDSMTPIGGMIPLIMILLGEVIFGGVGSGMYGMIVFVILTVFLAGLMVGRTPEYLGKKIGKFEIKMAVIAVLLPCAAVLIGCSLSVLMPAGKAAVFNPGPHGFTEILYANASAANNNGSAFAGLSANTVFYNTLLGLEMFIGRFGVIIPVLAIAGSLAAKQKTPSGSGTLPTHTPLFVFMVLSVIVLVGALSFLPALALGPIAEYLQTN